MSTRPRLADASFFHFDDEKSEHSTPIIVPSAFRWISQMTFQNVIKEIIFLLKEFILLLLDLHSILLGRPCFHSYVHACFMCNISSSQNVLQGL